MRSLGMKIYVCLESVLRDEGLRKRAAGLYDAGHTVVMACTSAYRDRFSLPSDLYAAIEVLEGKYHTLSFLKPEYDVIIDTRAEMPVSA